MFTKLFKNFDAGVRAALDISFSLADAFGNPPCNCTKCLLVGAENRRAEDDHFDSDGWTEESWKQVAYENIDNDSSGSGCSLTQREAGWEYCTGGGVYMEFTRLVSGGYLFYIDRPETLIKPGGSTFYRACIAAGWCDEGEHFEDAALDPDAIEEADYVY